MFVLHARLIFIHNLLKFTTSTSLVTQILVLVLNFMKLGQNKNRKKVFAQNHG